MRKFFLLGLTACISFTIQARQVFWFDGNKPVSYTVSGSVDPVVKIAVEMFCSDIKQVTGMNPVASRNGTIQIVQKKGSDDSFLIYVKGGRIVIEGNGGRGTAYGLLELSRMAGVSPWVWWGDVVPEKKAQLMLSDDFRMQHTPSVQYRGIFLNDEDWSLRPWSSMNYEPDDFGRIGPKTYKRIFQLLLRLRANAIWPAMHPGTVAFFKIPGAKQMADSCGIVIGTSHCEPLLRNNVDEWNVSDRGAFNYKTNREAVQHYWVERLEEVKHSKDNMFTIGMRGIHDGSMEGYKTMEEKQEGLQQVIDDQQVLLGKYIGDPSKLMQVFVPYKEVLEIYERGLRVPDYVTLMWCDDNYGYMTRLSNAKEQQRQGGGGVYYHLSYWGRPHDLLWLTTMQPGLVYNEMRQAYDHNVRRLWIVNVHDPKVAAYDLELFLDMAWDIECVNGQTLDNHLSRWLCTQFGKDTGERLFPVMREFYRLCGQRHPEFMGWSKVEEDKSKYDRGLTQVRNTAFNPAEFGNELDRYEMRYRTISREVDDIAKSVRPELKDAFFSAIQYPIQAAAAHCEKMLEAQRARMMARGSMSREMFECHDSLQRAIARSQQAYKRIRQLTDYYNNEMAGGKWRGIMNDHPRDLPVFWTPQLPYQVSDSIVPPDAYEHPSDMKCIGLECGVVARNAYEYDEATKGVQHIQMLGHSMEAVSVPKGGVLTYHFTIDKEGDYLLRTALIPTQPNDGGDLRYCVGIDGGTETEFSLKEPFRSERWKLNVLRGQSLRDQQVHLTAGAHTLTLRAIDDHVVFDQWMIDSNLKRQFYLIPAK